MTMIRALARCVLTIVRSFLLALAFFLVGLVLSIYFDSTVVAEKFLFIGLVFVDGLKARGVSVTNLLAIPISFAAWWLALEAVLLAVSALWKYGNLPIRCILGIHEWTGCKCANCGKKRDQEHNWTTDCEKCAICGMARSDAHAWAGCKCTKCHKTRDEWHEWTGDLQKCSRCGTPFPFQLVRVEDVPKIRQVIDKIAATSKCYEWENVDRHDYLSGSASHSDMRRRRILTPKDLSLSEEVGLDSNLLVNAAKAFCLHRRTTTGEKYNTDYISTIVGDVAVNELCRIKNQLSSYILYKVAAANPIKVSLRGCTNTVEYTFDFAERKEQARTELKRRGLGECDPLALTR